MKKPEMFDDPKNQAMLQAYQNAGIDLCPHTAHILLQNVDVRFRGEGVPLPSTVILDYLYGIAAYNAWRSERGDGLNQMKAYRDEHYAQIPPPPPAPPRRTPRKPTVLEEAMDELNMVLMRISGITPEMAAERREKEIEQEERAAQEASRSKVMEWRNRLDVN
jgi:hypothetical protein